jgi:predicted DNA binding CopG/RHH family protein
VRCIQVDNLTDTYTHALVAYAMTLYKPNSRFTEILLQRLKDKAIIEGMYFIPFVNMLITLFVDPLSSFKSN